MTQSTKSLLAVLAVGLVLLFAIPQTLDLFTVMQLTGFAAMAIFGLSQGFVWGYAGIMSFGQAMFLGLGGYAYAVAAFNMDSANTALLIGLLVPVIFAGLLGYFMFYGRISDAYVGVITMTVCIILFNLVNSTSGDKYRIGEAALGGFNGIPSIPSLTVPFDPDTMLSPDGLWYATMGALILTYLVLRWLLTTKFGGLIVAIRENETRVNLLGYDSRFFKLLAFMVSAGIAGLAGVLFTNWGAYISPTVFSLAISAQAIIFVLVGGLGTLIGPILGAFFLQWLFTAVGQQSALNANLFMGIVLILFVLLVPKGVVPLLRDDVLLRLLERKGQANKPQEAAE